MKPNDREIMEALLRGNAVEGEVGYGLVKQMRLGSDGDLETVVVHDPEAEARGSSGCFDWQTTPWSAGSFRVVKL